METLHKSKHHKHFYIEFDSPPNFYYTDGDAVEGRCVLLSARDEDVVAITLSFHGTVKTHITRYTYSKSTIVQPVESYSESVLFQEKKLLYQGTYTLRKNVLYEWTFRFKVPRNLPPSGRLGKVGMGSGQITYELEAARTTTGRCYERKPILFWVVSYTSPVIMPLFFRNILYRAWLTPCDFRAGSFNCRASNRPRE